MYRMCDRGNDANLIAENVGKVLDCLLFSPMFLSFSLSLSLSPTFNFFIWLELITRKTHTQTCRLFPWVCSLPVQIVKRVCAWFFTFHIQFFVFLVSSFDDKNILHHHNINVIAHLDLTSNWCIHDIMIKKRLF